MVTIIEKFTTVRMVSILSYHWYDTSANCYRVVLVYVTFQVSDSQTEGFWLTDKLNALFHFPIFLIQGLYFQSIGIICTETSPYDFLVPFLFSTNFNANNPKWTEKNVDRKGIQPVSYPKNSVLQFDTRKVVSTSTIQKILCSIFTQAWCT